MTTAIFGCMESGYANYNENANVDSTEDPSGSAVICYHVLGCTDNDSATNGGVACNYDPLASLDNSSCYYLASISGNTEDMLDDPGYYIYDCAGNCFNDDDVDGICNELEILGCTDSSSLVCNYNPLATQDDGTCSYFDAIYDCDGICWADEDGDLVCDQNEILGCQNSEACNYDETATDSGDCELAVEGCSTCINEEAIDTDTDGDGVADCDEVLGCIESDACNYNSIATDEDICTYPDETYLDCSGDCINDTDGDGVCNELEVLGCMDSEALNYDDSATDDDGTCNYIVSGCTDSNYTEYDPLATEDNGSCATLIGCTNPGYYEYNIDVDISDPDSCQSKIGDYNLDGNIDLDDLFAVLGNWLESGEVGIQGDVNRDGIVDLDDLFDVLGNWLQ